MSLDKAPDEIKLAVDLICLLEKNDIPSDVVLKALAIVKKDYEKKLKGPPPFVNQEEKR